MVCDDFLIDQNTGIIDNQLPSDYTEIWNHDFETRPDYSEDWRAVMYMGS